MFTAVLNFFRRLPGEAWAVIAGLFVAGAIYVVGKFRGREQAQLEDVLEDVEANEQRDEAMKTAHETAHAEAEKKISEAIKEELEEKAKPVTADQLNEIKKEFEEWPDD
jgi:uncharacterized protein HemX